MKNSESGSFLSRLFGRRSPEPCLLEQPPRRAQIARLPSRYIVDAGARVTASHTHGLVRFDVQEAVLLDAQKGQSYFCTVSIGKQSWATSGVKAKAAGAPLAFDQGSDFVVQRGGASIVRVALFKQAALGNHLEAWCEVDLAAHFVIPAVDAGAAADAGAATPEGGPVVAGEFELRDPADAAAVRGHLRLSGHASTLGDLERQVWENLLALADFSGDGVLSQEELGALLRAFGSGLSPEELGELFKAADADASGGVDAGELAAALSEGGRFGRLVRRCPVDGAELSADPQDHASNLLYVALALSSARAAAAGGGAAAGELRAGFGSQAQAARSWVMQLSEWAAHPLSGKPFAMTPARRQRYRAGGLRLGPQAAHILVFDRRSKMVVEEALSPVLALAMRNMYQSKVGRAAMRQGLAKKLVGMSAKEGRARDSPESAALIRPFVDGFRGEIAVEEAEKPLDEYATFNEFFYRKLKPGARPVAAPGDPDVVVSAADCRLQVYDSVDDATRFWIKGRHFSVAGLLAEDDPERPLAAGFQGGTMAIFRLAPQDYHRFHTPVGGTVLSITDVPGGLLTVNPIAVNSAFCDVFTENKRAVLVLEAEGWGRVALVAVGATLVGSINWTVGVGDRVDKGAELGYFSFGGSTVIALFPDLGVAWDADLGANSKRSLESLVKVGERIGARAGSAAEGVAAERAALSRRTMTLTRDAGVAALEERRDLQGVLKRSESEGVLTTLLDVADARDAGDEPPDGGGEAEEGA